MTTTQRICKTCVHLSMSNTYCKKKGKFLTYGNRRKGDRLTREAIRIGATLAMDCWEGEHVTPKA